MQSFQSLTDDPRDGAQVAAAHTFCSRCGVHLLRAKQRSAQFIYLNALTLKKETYIPNPIHSSKIGFDNDNGNANDSDSRIVTKHVNDNEESYSCSDDEANEYNPCTRTRNIIDPIGNNNKKSSSSDNSPTNYSRNNDDTIFDTAFPAINPNDDNTYVDDLDSDVSPTYDDDDYFDCSGSIRTTNTHRSFMLHRNGNKKNLANTLSSRNATYQHRSHTNESNSKERHHHHHHHSRTIINSTQYPEYQVNSNTTTALSSQQQQTSSISKRNVKNNHPNNASSKLRNNEYTDAITQNSSTHKFTNTIINNNSSSSNVICTKTTIDQFPTTGISLAAAAAALSKEQSNKRNNSSSSIRSFRLDSSPVLSSGVGLIGDLDAQSVASSICSGGGNGGGLDNMSVTSRYSVSSSYSHHTTISHHKHHNKSHASSSSSTALRTTSVEHSLRRYLSKHVVSHSRSDTTTGSNDVTTPSHRNYSNDRGNVGNKTDNTDTNIRTERVTTSNDIISSLPLPSSPLSNIQNTTTTVIASPTATSAPAFHAVTDNDSYDDKKENQVDFDTTNNNNNNQHNDDDSVNSTCSNVDCNSKNDYVSSSPTPLIAELEATVAKLRLQSTDYIDF
jgi:hypothetical protein